MQFSPLLLDIFLKDQADQVNQCDEIRPNCGSCTRRDLDCTYKGESHGAKHADRVRLITDQLDLSHKTFNPTAQQDYFNSQFLRMWPRLWPGKATPHVLANDPAAFTSRFDLPILHHLTEGTIGPSLVSISQLCELSALFRLTIVCIAVRRERPCLPHRRYQHRPLPPTCDARTPRGICFTYSIHAASDARHFQCH